MTAGPRHRRASAPAVFDALPRMPRRINGAIPCKDEQINPPWSSEVRSVQTAVKAAADALREGAVDLPKARALLEHAEDALDSMEFISLSRNRLKCDSVDVATRGAAFASDINFCDNVDTAKWLLDTFTEHLDNADDDGDFEMQVSKRKSLSVRRMSHPKMFLRERAESMKRTLALPTTAAVLEKCGGMDFNALDLAAALEGALERPLPVFGAHVLQYQGDLVDCIQERGWIIGSKDSFLQTFVTFLNRLDSLYKPEIRYHNSSHAVDVMATMDVFMRTKYVTQRTTSLDHLMALAAAAIHDVGHPGKNAAFQTKTMSPLALLYNDKSILENMHASLAFSTMQESECNWLALLAKDDGSHQTPNLPQYVRQGIISMVLATDMAKHQKYVSKLVALAEQAEAGSMPPPEQEKVEDKFFMLDTLLHAADLSNPGKPRKIALSWTRRVCEEFWLQGDEEKRLGLAISPLCDRQAGEGTVPQSQLGFINFVVRPLYNPLVKLVPELQQVTQQLDENVAFWEEQKVEVATFVQLFGEEPSR